MDTFITEMLEIAYKNNITSLLHIMNHVNFVPLKVYNY